MEGSLQQYAPIKIIPRERQLNASFEEFNIQTSHQLNDYTFYRDRQLPISLDSSSHFIHHSRLPQPYIPAYPHHSNKKMPQTTSSSFYPNATKNSKFSKTGNQKVMKKDRIKSKYRADVPMKMFEGYADPSNIALESLKKNHHLLRSIVKAREESQQDNVKNEFNQSLERIQKVYRQERMLKPNRLLPKTHIRKREQFQKEFQVSKQDDIPIVDLFRNPQKASNLIREGHIYHYELNEAEEALKMEKQRNHKADFELIRNSNMERWFRRHSGFHPVKQQRVVTFNRRGSLLSKIRTASIALTK